jgi:hypothetical protein
MTFDISRDVIAQPGRRILIHKLAGAHQHIESSVDTTCWMACNRRSGFGGHHLLVGLYPAQLFKRLVQCTFT